MYKNCPVMRLSSSVSIVFELNPKSDSAYVLLIARDNESSVSQPN